MRHHVQEKKKRKLSHGAMSAEAMQDAPSWSIENDSGYENIDPPAMTGGQALPAEEDPLVWKTNSIASFLEAIRIDMLMYHV